MKINTSTSLSSPALLLVPYTVSHVPTYHSWMQDPALQSATASEPLSLDEEYAMQQSWRSDHDKLTFVICLPLEKDSEVAAGDAIAGRTVQGGVDDRAERMVGDINLFLFEWEDDNNDNSYGSNAPAEGKRQVVGELELMIARTELQRKGYGRAALLVFTEFILAHWAKIAQEYDKGLSGPGRDGLRQLAYLRVKINQGNLGSIRLFETLAFQQFGPVANYFGEVELRWQPDIEVIKRRSDRVDWLELEYQEAML